MCIYLLMIMQLNQISLQSISIWENILPVLDQIQLED